MAANAKKAAYGDQSIKSLKGADRVRKRPAVIFGSDDIIGCQHSFIEILANSVDEAREGYGDKIIVKKYLDLSIEVEDFGRGVPLGYNEKEKRWNWELVFCELYAGGKYDNNDGNSAYEFSLGLNGLGATATQYSSEYMEVRSYNGKTLSSIDFKAGIILNKKTGDKVCEGDVIATLYTDKADVLEEAGNMLIECMDISENPVEKQKLIFDVIGG